MANKFLPFIVEQSTPLNTYQTILSRGKGMNVQLLASLFNLVLKKGVDELRGYVKTLPDMPLDELYKNVVNYYPGANVSDSDIQLYLRLGDWLDRSDFKPHDELREFTTDDLMIFFLVVRMNNEKYPLGQYTDFNFPSKKQWTEVFNHLADYVPFSDSGERKEFTDPQDLAGFVLWHTYFSNYTPENGFNAVFVDVKEESDDAS